MTRNRLILILLFVMGTICSADAAEDSVVMTEQGGVAGTVTPTLRMFLGVPYAAPPVGDLRWTPPQPHAPRDTPLDATQFRSHCAQVASVFGAASVSEDCLFLNIFTPSDQATEGNARSPVMVWIHGGALTFGESDDYIPTKLVQQGHVIVVTINYRLGAFGFLAHPALSAESADHISGNYGLMDQQFALKWVQRNIAAFGGDPRNVTIFGQSGGGLSVFSNLASPLAAGLFHRAIVQSGAYELGLPTLADEESHGVAFAASVGCKDQSAQCLRSKSVKKILANWGLDSNPNVDGKLLRQSLDTAVATGQFNHVPVMQGTNHDEWRFFVALDELSGAPIPAAAYPSAIVDLVGPDAAPLVLAEYPLDNFASPSLALGAVGTDLIFACPARGADQVLSTQVPTFAYEFNDGNAPELFLPPVSFPYGATHASELLYLFKLTRPGELDAQQQILSDNMVRYWVQFARSGNPNAPGLPLWPRYDNPTDKFQSLLPPSPMPEFQFASDHKCDFWARLFAASIQRGAAALR